MFYLFSVGNLEGSSQVESSVNKREVSSELLEIDEAIQSKVRRMNPPLSQTIVPRLSEPERPRRLRHFAKPPSVSDKRWNNFGLVPPCILLLRKNSQLEVFASVQAFRRMLGSL